MLATLKLYWRAAVGAVLGALGIAVSVLAKRNRTLKDERDDAREHADHAVEVITRDNEIEEQADAKLAEAVRALNDGELPEELLDPNRGWTDD